MAAWPWLVSSAAWPGRSPTVGATATKHWFSTARALALMATREKPCGVSVQAGTNTSQAPASTWARTCLGNSAS